jgi:Flp pilus assembly pilin Flp
MPRLTQDDRGAGLVEYLLVLGLVALVALGGYRTFGHSADSKVEAQAECVRRLDGQCNGAPGVAIDVPARGMPPPLESGSPDFGGVKGGKDAAYKPAKGDGFIEGAGDGRGPHPNDVSQGQIGDCYLMAALAAMAHRRPEVINKNVKDNGDGTFTVTFYEQRTWRSPKKVDVVVKAEFPARDGNWVFAQPGDKSGDKEELWPMLYEKAWAQYKGGGDYAKIVGGHPHNVWQAMTGETSNWHSTTGLWDMSFKDFASHVDAGPVAAGTVSKGDGKKIQLFKDSVLYAEHAYWVESVNRDAKTVTVRNPWGWNEKPITLSWDDFKKGFPTVYVNR